MLRTYRLLLLLASVSAIAACSGGDQPVTTRDSTPSSQTDTTPPLAPTGLSGAPMSSTAVNLSWTASSDNVGVASYAVSRNGARIGTITTTSYVDSGLAAATTYQYAVAALDAAGNMSPSSPSINVTTSAAGPTADTTPPSQPSSFTAVAAGATSVNLSWGASTDNVGVTGYIVRRNGVQVATPTTTSFANTGLTASTTYTYTVVARDAAGNQSTAASASVTTSGTTADTTPPSQPSSFTATAAGATAVNLSWGASTDNVGVTGYIVRRNGVQVATPTTTSFANTGLTASTTYTYTVVARDAAGNQSTAASASVTTAPPPQATGSANLAWDPVVDPNLAGYRVYYGNAPGIYFQALGQGVGAGNVTTVSVAGLVNGTRYYFAVTATDTLGNESTYSNEVFKDIP